MHKSLSRANHLALATFPRQKCFESARSRPIVHFVYLFYSRFGKPQFVCFVYFFVS